MKGFIRITDVTDKVHYININHIIKFSNADARVTANTSIRIIGGDATSSIQTMATIDEVVEMIVIANK